MRKFAAWLLTVLMVLSVLAGCRKQSGADNSEPTENDAKIGDSQAEVVDILNQALDVQIDDKTLTVEAVQQIDGKTVARCNQNYHGVEVLGGSVVAIGGEEPQMIGTYYDLSQAFGEDFDSAVEQAGQVPDWMKDEVIDGMEVTYHTDTLKPVIYIEENEPVIALQFDVTLGGIRYTMVMDPSGQTCYQYDSSFCGFESVQNEDGIYIAEQNGKYYAYDMEHSIYISTAKNDDEEELEEYYDGSGAVVKKSLIRELTGENADQLSLRLLSAAADVMQWYEDQFAYRGVDGKGGEAMCIIVSESALGSIAANACEKGHIFLLAFNLKMESIAEAPEIFAHEMGHAVLKNVANLKNSNQSGSLHEAISDVFACLYDSDGDWKVGDGLFGVSSRNIAGYNRTMQDFRYDYQYMDTDLDGDMDYIGENNILTYLRSKVVGTERCSYGRYYNAAIVSGVLHKIWRDVLEKDDDMMGWILMDSLQYLPQNADFADFRSAFMYSCRKLSGNETARRVGALFDSVRIYHDSDNYIVIQEKETPDNVAEMLDKTYSEVRAMSWDSCEVDEVYDVWYCFCTIGNYSMNFSYGNTKKADPKALPNSVDLFYYNDNRPIDPVPIVKGLKFGMTYGQIAKKFDISPLENTEYVGSEYPVVARIETEEYRFILIFTGVDENAVFNGVSIMRK